MAWLCMLRPHYLFGQKSRFWPTFLKSFSGLFIWFLRVKIYPLTYTHKSRALGGCFEEWFTVCLQNQDSDAFRFQRSKLDRWFSDKRRRCSFKICSSPIWMKTAFWGGVLEKGSQHIYKISTIEKTSSTYTHKNGVLRTLLRAMFTVCLQKSYSKNCPLT